MKTILFTLTHTKRTEPKVCFSLLNEDKVYTKSLDEFLALHQHDKLITLDANAVYEHHHTLLTLIDVNVLRMLYQPFLLIQPIHSLDSLTVLVNRINHLYTTRQTFLPKFEQIQAFTVAYNMQALSGSKGLLLDQYKLLAIRKEITTGRSRFVLDRKLPKKEYQLQHKLYVVEDMILRSSLTQSRLLFKANMQRTGRIGTFDYNIQGLSRELRYELFSDLIEIDWSMAELHTLAKVILHYLPKMPSKYQAGIEQSIHSGNSLIARLQSGLDLHQDTSQRIKDDTGYNALRSVGKKTNFGLNYGLSATEFHKDLVSLDDTITLEMSERIKQSYFNHNQDVKLFQQWINECSPRYINTLSGRLIATNGDMPSAMAYLCQGSIADDMANVLFQAKDHAEQIAYSHFDALYLWQDSEAVRESFGRFAPLVKV
jgi:hypothetical protein